MSEDQQQTSDLGENTGCCQTLEVKLLADDAVLPVRQHAGDAGLDLVSIEAVQLAPGERQTVATGIAVKIPAGHAGFVVPRSGLASKLGLTLANTPGIIDSGYRGELKLALHNSDRHAEFAAKPGERLAQLLIVPVCLPTPVVVSELDQSGRGGGGFGSTGT